jgi:hypothetical protein
MQSNGKINQISMTVHETVSPSVAKTFEPTNVPDLLYIGRSATVKHYLHLALHGTFITRDSYYTAIQYLLSGARPRVIFSDAVLNGGGAVELHRFIH